MQTTNLDRTAAAGSIACVVHCLALPFVALVLPFMAAVADAEWIHWTFTALAVIASLAVIVTASNARVPSFLVPASLGMTLVVGALAGEHWGIDETLPTVIGGVLLAMAHIRRLYASA